MRDSSRRSVPCPPALGILAAALLLLPLPAAGQTIRGIVLEDGSDQPIGAATIEVVAADGRTVETVTSDPRGWFTVELDEPGEYSLRPSHLSYTSAGSRAVQVEEHEIVTLVLRMGRSAIPLEPLRVSARTFNRLAGFYQRMESGRQGRFIDREFIDGRVTYRPSQLLSMTPGMRITKSDDGLTYDISMSGIGGRCTPNVYLDGLPVPPGITTIDDLTASDMIEGVEIYDSYALAPDIFPVSMNSCGVVAFWSRREARRPLTWKRVALGVLAVGAFAALVISQ